MQSNLVLLFILISAGCLASQNINSRDPSSASRSRHKRYVTFPQDSSLQLVYCLTVPLLIPNTIFTLGWTAGVAWQLPNDTRAFNYPHNKREQILHRRDRREILPKIEAFLGSRGFNGRQCVKRAICEAARRTQLFQSSKPKHFLYELIHAIFSFPVQNILESENEDKILMEYLSAHDVNIPDCALEFPLCPGSLFEFIFKPFTNPKHKIK